MSAVIDSHTGSEAEKASLAVAEDSRETDWKSKSFMASMFMGDLDVGMSYPFPEQDPTDKAEGDALLERMNAWADQELDGDRIDRDQKIPAHVFKGLNDLGLWGVKIPKEYGGLGMSQMNYMRVLGDLSVHCGATAATLSAHQSIGVPQPLKLFGTKEQKAKYLPRVAKGAISAFALTEPGVGSDPAAMKTFAEPSEDGSHWVLNGEKLWCTNGVIADLLVVMAKTPSKMKRGREVQQITAFIVDADTEGVEVMHRCEFLGIRAIENGLIRFTNVKVPSENIILGEGKGLRLALTTLNDGRLGIPAVGARVVRELAHMGAQWAKSRFQWGKHIGEHEECADMLADLGGGAYAMKALSDYCGALSDQGGRDLRMEAATAKLYNTERLWTLADRALQLRGGRGFESESSLKARGEAPFPIERALRDARINRIVEGTTEIMHLFLAREALDKHLRMAGPLLGRASVGVKLKTLLRCAAFYPAWYAKLWLGGLFKSFGRFDGRLAKHLRFVERNTRRMARTLFHAMVQNGPKLEARQKTLARLVDLGAELAVMCLVASRLQSALDRGDDSDLEVGLYHLDAATLRVDQLFWSLKHNTDRQVHGIAKGMMEGVDALPDIVTPPELRPLPRERGSDLTSGRLTSRVDKSGRVGENAAK